MPRRKIKNRLPPFVAMTWQMLNSEAYKDLTFSARACLPYFLGKVRNCNFKSEERYIQPFQFPRSEARRYGFNPKTFSKAFRDLIRKGFVDPVKRGGLKGCGFGHSRFKLSRRWEDYGKPGFERKEWNEFEPDL